MGKKTKEEIEEEEMFSDDLQDDEELEDNEEDFNYEEDAKEPVDLDEMPANPMGLAHQISKESETYKNFKELPREVKYSFLDTTEKLEVKHFARTYRNHQYIEKIIDLRVKEDDRLREVRKKVVDIKSKEDLIKYLKACNKDYLINDVLDLSFNEIQLILSHVKNLKHNYLLDTIENNKKEIKSLYDEYKLDHDTPEYIDDMGNVGRIVDTSVSSMGYKGNASQHSVMTINAVKNEDIQKVAEEKSKFSFMDAIKSKFG